MTEKEWLESLKEGDEVAVGVGFSGVTIRKVDRRTPQFVTVGDMRFSVRTGRGTGCYRLNSPSIWKPTDEDRRKVRRKQLTEKAERFFRKMGAISDEHLQRVVDLIEELESETT